MRTRKSAFTLVELLVVVTIISILAALLLPALSRTMATARSLSCLNNHKQFGLAAMGYVDSYNGWALCTDPDVGFMWSNTLLGEELIGDERVFFCSSEPKAGLTSVDLSYGLNYRTFGARLSHGTCTPKKASQISSFNNDSNLIHIADSTPLAYTTPVGDASYLVKNLVYPLDSGSAYTVYNRHTADKASCLFADGHAGGLDYFELKDVSHWKPWQNSGNPKVLTD